MFKSKLSALGFELALELMHESESDLALESMLDSALDSALDVMDLRVRLLPPASTSMTLRVGGLGVGPVGAGITSAKRKRSRESVREQPGTQMA